MTKRLFAAIKYKPDQKILKLIDDLKSYFQSDKMKWVDLNRLHLTLKFFGDTDTERINELIGPLKESAQNGYPLTLSVKKLSAFYRGDFPSVLFLKLKENDDLFRLANTISELSETCGFKQEKRLFKAHITLARITYINDIQLFNEVIKTELNHVFFADSFILYESKLTRTGSIYSVVKKFGLNE